METLNKFIVTLRNEMVLELDSIGIGEDEATFKSILCDVMQEVINKIITDNQDEIARSSLL